MRLVLPVLLTALVSGRGAVAQPADIQNGQARRIEFPYRRATCAGT